MTISDDGKGINKEKVLKHALDKGLLNREEVDQLKSRDILNLIFQPGFSTLDQATRFSGRGVGMDSVKHEVEALGGTIKVRSAEGEGTIFEMKTPLI